MGHFHAQPLENKAALFRIVRGHLSVVSQEVYHGGHRMVTAVPYIQKKPN